MKEENVPLQNRTDIKLLVVDDREDNLFSIETILEKDGYQIIKASSGRAALKVLLTQHDFTLILMDVQMPDMNGFETATLIYQRDKLKHIPIIFITAQNKDEEYVFQGYKMGAVDFIYKPINPELLRFKVSVFVEMYRKNHLLLQQEKELKSVNQFLQKEIEERKISEQKIKLLNQQLRENNDELKSINEELDRFAYVASHDLQEPLRKILLFSDKIAIRLKEKMDNELQESLGKIVRSSGRMQLLITDLLKFSRHANTPDDFCLVNINDLLNDVLADLEIEIQNKKGEVVVGQLPTIWAIPSQVRQLFQNLLSNSLKFSKPGRHPKISVYSDTITRSAGEKQRPEDNLFCRIFIEDNGIGFDQKYAQEIFVVFKRLHSHHEFEGTGIGLAIVDKIISKHGGEVWVEAELNKGATFYFSLPVDKE